MPSLLLVVAVGGPSQKESDMPTFRVQTYETKVDVTFYIVEDVDDDD
jgi:hypothetical protein